MYDIEPGDDANAAVLMIDTEKPQMLDTADVLPASGPVTLYVTSGPDSRIGTETDQYLCVGWDECGCPVVMDRTGKLRRLEGDERVTDADW